MQPKPNLITLRAIKSLQAVEELKARDMRIRSGTTAVHPDMSSSSSWSFLPSSVPSLSLLPTQRSRSSLPVRWKCKTPHTRKDKVQPLRLKLKKFGLLLQHGAALAAIETSPAWAVTGNNVELDLTKTLIEGGIVAVLYFLVIPPIIMNWMRLRWYKRKFFEMYLQFMFVFIFFPGLLLWAPFLNFRKFPRDPTMKHPWSTPKEDVPLYKSR